MCVRAYVLARNVFHKCACFLFVNVYVHVHEHEYGCVIRDRRG